MKILNNYVNNYTKIIKSGNNTDSNMCCPNIQKGNKNKVKFTSANAISPINTNIPISYVKTGEISIPGIKEKASVFKLANGQKVVILPKKGITTIETLYNVGSLNEKDEERGISHFIEHNLFNGSKNIAPKEYDKIISSKGGSSNAYTSFSVTDYNMQLQLLDDNSLEEAIKLNANLTQYPTFQKEQLEKEKEPVKSEIDMGKDSQGNIGNEVIKTLFNITSTSENLITGEKNNINNLTQEKVFDYFNTWYTPDNAVTVITGDVDVNETINLVSKYFNKTNDYSKINQRKNEPIKYLDKTVRKDVISKNSNSPLINMGFAIPEGTSDKEKNEIQILLNILTANSSRLSKALSDYGISLNYSFDKVQNKPDGAIALMLEVEPYNEKDTEKILKILYDEITYIANNPPTDEELLAQKNLYIKNLNELSESNENINAQLLKIMTDGGNLNYFTDEINYTSNLTGQDISNAAKKFLDLNKSAICISHSKDSTSETINNNYSEAQKQNFVSSQPIVYPPNNNLVSFGNKCEPIKEIETKINNITGYKLQNNIETRIIPSNINSQSHFTIDFCNENLNDVSSPLMDILSILLNRGNAFTSPEAMKDFFDKNNISNYITVNNNGLSYTYNCYPENLQSALNFAKTTLLNPNFTEEEFQRAKSIIKDEYESSIPSAYNKTLKSTCPNVKSLTTTKEENLEELDKITLQDVKNLYSKMTLNSEVIATLSAPVKENPQLTQIFNNEMSTGFPQFQPINLNHNGQYNMYKPNTQEKVFTEAIENSQAHVTQTYTFKKSENISDLAKISLLNIILGSGMTSRLFLDLREDKKLAYRVTSYNTYLNDIGYLKLYTETSTDSIDSKEGSPENIDKSINAFKNNVQLLKTQNVTAEELETAKNKLKTEILSSFETTSQQHGILTDNYKSPYGINFYRELINSIDNITADDIRMTANYVFENPPVISIDASQKTLDSLKL